MQKITGFFHGVAEEMRKVRWPKPKELTRYTVIVFGTVIFFTIFFTLLDLGISQLIELIL